MKRLALLFFAPTVALAAPSAPDGAYACALDGRALGSIRLAGGQYFGLYSGSEVGPAKRFITMDPNRIEWLGDMGALSTAGYRVDKTEIRVEAGRTFIDLTLLPPNGSAFVKAICAPAS